jgi:hypothetical protein
MPPANDQQSQDFFDFGNDSIFGDDEPPNADDLQDQQLVTQQTQDDARDWNQAPGPSPRRLRSWTRRQYQVMAVQDNQPPTPVQLHNTQREADAVVLTSQNDVLRVIITEPDDPTQNTEVEVQGAPEQFITRTQVDETTRPVRITVYHTQADDLIRDLPMLDLTHIPIRPPPKGPAKNPYERQLRSYARPGNQSRYNLRSKTLPNPANNAQVKYFKPP